MNDTTLTYHLYDHPTFNVYLKDTSSSYKTIENQFFTETSQKFEKVPKENLHPQWYFFIFFSVLIIFTLIKVYFGEKIQWIYQSIYNRRTTEKLIRDINPTSDQHSILLLFNFLIMGGFFLYKLKIFYTIEFLNLQGISEFSLSIGVLLLYILFYEFCLWIIGLLTDNVKPVKLFVFNVRTIYYTLGIILIPINIFLIYQYLIDKEILIIIGCSAVLVSIILKMAKGFQILVQNKVFLFYQFLYLCTLEIMPFILMYDLYKWVIIK